jgi:hypothetical protein
MLSSCGYCSSALLFFGVDEAPDYRPCCICRAQEQAYRRATKPRRWYKLVRHKPPTSKLKKCLIRLRLFTPCSPSLSLCLVEWSCFDVFPPEREGEKPKKRRGQRDKQPTHGCDGGEHTHDDHPRRHSSHCQNVPFYCPVPSTSPGQGGPGNMNWTRRQQEAA